MGDKRYTNQQLKKLYDKKCFFCEEDDYAILDAHRILPGAEGGTYDWINTLTVCSNCHRRIHAGEILVDRKYGSTGGLVLHYFIGETEYWKQA